MGQLNLSADDVLRTTRAVRKRIDFDRPVEDEVLRECLELALQAPTGSNAQTWRWVVVTDPAKKEALAGLYQQAFEAYKATPFSAANVETGGDQVRAEQQGRVMDSAQYLADNLARVPAMLIPCLPMKLDGLPNFVAASLYGSIMPAAWSFMLAARERGLGTSWTSLHLMFEEQAAEVLGIPFAEVSQVALITVGYTQGTDFKPAHREPLDTVVSFNGWS